MSNVDVYRDEAQALIRSIAGPVNPAGGVVKGAIRNASLALGFSYDRCRRYWYGKVGTVPAHEMDRLRQVAARLDARRAATVAKVAELEAQL